MTEADTTIVDEEQCDRIDFETNWETCAEVKIKASWNIPALRQPGNYDGAIDLYTGQEIIQTWQKIVGLIESIHGSCRYRILGETIWAYKKKLRGEQRITGRIDL